MRILESNNLSVEENFSIKLRPQGDDILVKCRAGDLGIREIFKSLREMYPTRFRGAIIYCEDTFRDNLRQVKSRLEKYFGKRHRLLWAVKSAPIKKLLEIAAEEGVSFDVGSTEELLLARSFALGDRIYHTAPGKFDWDIQAIAQHGCVSISDNLTELELLDAKAKALGRRLSVGIRINPSIQGSTQSEIATGTPDCKFGIPEMSDSFIDGVRKLSNLNPDIAHMHIGSQIADPTDYENAIHSLLLACRKLESRGLGMGTIDIGGGFPYRYLSREAAADQGSLPDDQHVFHNYVKPAFQDYLRRIQAVFVEHFPGRMPCIAIEPGRLITAGAAFAVGYVLHAKNYPNGIRWLISSISVNDFYHKVPIPDTYYDVRVLAKNGAAPVPTAIGGTLCFSGDILTPRGCAVNLPEKVGRDDILLFNGVGAYSILGSGNYHNMPRLPILMIDTRGKLVEIREQETPYFEEAPRKMPA